MVAPLSDETSTPKTAGGCAVVSTHGSPDSEASWLGSESWSDFSL